jgi:influenza virus NS1A-binding protein
MCIFCSSKGRYQAGIASYNGHVWVIGGSDAWNCLASSEIYDPECNQWNNGPTLLTPRRGCGLAEFNGKLYAVGGSDGNHSLTSTECYEEDSQTWVSYFILL